MDLNRQAIITSYGIIPYVIIENDIRYLLICRKDSLGFIEFVRGKYPPNKEYILGLIDEMTITEKNILLEKDFKYIWEHLWVNYSKTQGRGEYINAEEKFNRIRMGIIGNSKSYFNLENLIEDSGTCWEKPEWGFPKGRKNYKEGDIRCALREFKEETGLDVDKTELISNIIPFDEIFIGSNYKIYKHTYFIANYKGDLSRKNFQKTEVSDMKWVTYKEGLGLIRDYNKERLDIFRSVNTVLRKHQIIN
jgi:ADP-ribose pyrophosphatase YjhB (NUDIX family)